MASQEQNKSGVSKPTPVVEKDDEKKSDSNKCKEKGSDKLTSGRGRGQLSLSTSKSISKSKSKSKGTAQTHSRDIHSLNNTNDDGKEPDITQSIPMKKPTSREIELLKHEKNEKKRLKKMSLIESNLNFKSIDSNKTIMADDICLYVQNARNLTHSLQANQNHVSKLKTRGETVQFAYDSKYNVWIRVLSKSEINSMPDWSTNVNTKAGLYYILLQNVNVNLKHCNSN